MILIEKLGKGILLTTGNLKKNLISKWSYWIQDIVESNLIYIFYHCVDSHSEVLNSAGRQNE